MEKQKSSLKSSRTRDEMYSTVCRIHEEFQLQLNILLPRFSTTVKSPVTYSEVSECSCYIALGQSTHKHPDCGHFPHVKAGARSKLESNSESPTSIVLAILTACRKNAELSAEAYIF